MEKNTEFYHHPSTSVSFIETYFYLGPSCITLIEAVVSHAHSLQRLTFKGKTYLNPESLKNNILFTIGFLRVVRL